MAVIKCADGHYYDDGKYSECPHCKESANDKPIKIKIEDDEKTIALIKSEISKNNGDDSKTVGIFRKKYNADPVAGWLVCTEGKERGRDYRLFMGRNHIGRSHKMDVSIADDPMISAEKHCSVIYDPKSDQFIIMPGEGTLTYFNETILTESKTIEEGDIIKMGESSFVFVPFCKEGRNWQ